MLKKYRNSMLYRRLKILGMIIFVIVVALAGYLWLQEAPLREAQELINRSEAEAALKLIKDWETQYSPSGSSQALRARCFVQIGRFTEAIQIFQMVGAEDEKEIHDWAKAHLSLKQWSEALPLLKELHRRNPEDADVLHELAACQTKLGAFEAALQTAHQFASHEEYSHRAWLLIGVIQQDRGNKEKALEAWERISEWDPEYRDLQIPAEEFLTQFASLQIELGNVERASRLLSNALSIRETADAHFQAGLVKTLRGDTAEATQHWKRALELNPYHLNSRESLARSAIASGEGDSAERILTPIIESGQVRSSTAYLMQRASYLQGNQEAAKRWKLKTEHLRRKEEMDNAVVQILRENPNSYWGRVIRAYQFAERGNSSQAAKILNALPVAEKEHSFVSDLKNSVFNHEKLPSKDRLPIQLF